jgi:hypothetical protein
MENFIEFIKSIIITPGYARSGIFSRVKKMVSPPGVLKMV